ncbi:MAG: deoxyhypusine synthase family protein [Chloroflexi bacterium]|nr:deoxyhypusine synthase family protein [Chloroflexota bacterium]
MNEHLHTPVVPFSISVPCSAAQLLNRMSGTSFQARNLGQAAEIWMGMLKDETTIFFGLAGAMVPAGMRPVIVYLIENRLIDVLVSTGANLFHDLYETIGKRHWQGSAMADDLELAQANINRIYDVYAPEPDVIYADEYITRFSLSLDHSRAYTTREYFYLLGKELTALAVEPGIITAAAAAGVPIYCPAFGDSVFGMSVGAARVKSGQKLLFDIVQDVLEMTQIFIAAPVTGVIYVAGGTPKNFIQQATIASYIYGQKNPGHRHAIQITADTPQWGGLSGCTFQEAQSWKKLSFQAHMVTINADATIALPLLVSAVAERHQHYHPRLNRPTFSLEGEMGIDPGKGGAIPKDR